MSNVTARTAAVVVGTCDSSLPSCRCCCCPAAAGVLNQAAEGPEDRPALMQLGLHWYARHQRMQLVQRSTNHTLRVIYQQQRGLLLW